MDEIKSVKGNLLGFLVLVQQPCFREADHINDVLRLQGHDRKPIDREKQGVNELLLSMLPCTVSLHIALECIFIENAYERVDILEKDGHEQLGFNRSGMILGQG